MSDPICPECVAGKHRNCDGIALDETTDTFATCCCPDCHVVTPACSWCGQPSIELVELGTDMTRGYPVHRAAWLCDQCRDAAIREREVQRAE